MSASGSSQGQDSWISSFCSLIGHEYFAEVSEEFIEDDFNLTGLQAQVPLYKDALEMILDVEASEDESGLSEEEEEEEEEEEDDGILGDELDQPMPNRNGVEPQTSRRVSGPQDPTSTAGTRSSHRRSASDVSQVESSAELLYGLIHARYITSRPGIQQMLEKYDLSHFGYCPRVYCGGARVLPVGRTDTPGMETVKLFCPSCLDVYTPPNSRFQAVDGAFFGTTFGCLFFMTFPDLEIAPQRKTRGAGAVTTSTNNDDAEDTVISPTDTNTTPGGMTASRSSSLTLPNAPPIPGVTSTKDEKAAAEAAIMASLPPQPATINGVATHNLAPGLGKGKIYEPRIYGFRVSERAKGGPRMKWLRSKPLDINGLDEARIWHEKYGGNIDGDPDPEVDEDTGNAEDEADGDAIMASSQPRTRRRKNTTSSRKSKGTKDGGAELQAG